MAEVNLTNLQNALKRAYPVKDMTNQLYNMRPLFAQLKKETTAIEQSGDGLKAFVPIQTMYNASTGSIAEGGVLPVGRAPKYLQLQIPVAYHYSTVEFSGQSLAAVKKNSFLSEVDLKMQGVKEDTIRSIDRQLTNGNTSGMLCQTSSAGGGATATVDVDNPGSQFLEIGMPVYSLSAETAGAAVADSSISEGLTEATSYTVLDIPTENTFTLGNAARTAAHTTEKWADNQYIFRYGSANQESMGLKGICDNYAIRATSSWYGLGTATQTVFSIDRATNPILDATVEHNGNVNAAISELRILRLLNKIEKSTGKSGESADRVFVSSFEVRDRFFDIISPDRRFTMDTVNLKGGYSTMAFQYGNSKIPWIVSKQAIPNSLFALDLRFLNIYQAGDMKWIEQTAGQMFDIKTDALGRYHIYIGTLAYFCGLGCKNFKAQGVLRDITEV